MDTSRRVFSSLLCLVASFALALVALVGVAHADTSYVAGSISGSDGSSVTAQDTSSAAVSTQASKKSGWQTTKSGKTVYYRKGAKVTGLQKIGGNRYYFSEKGVMKTADVTVGDTTYYLNPDGTLIAMKAGSKYYYNTLKRMSDADVYDFETYQRAREIVNDITDKNDSMETKLHTAFDWVMNKYYEIHRVFNPYEENWTAIYARDHFDDLGGDCHADGSAFAYLAAAIGYEADVCLDALIVGTPGSHCWAMIGDRVYDPLFAQSKSYEGYYGVTSGTYETNPTARYRVPRFDPANATDDAEEAEDLVKAGTNGLKKVGKYYYFFKDGKKLKSTWKTVKGKRYYFKKNGRAATYSTKIKGAYYVFNKKGVLQKSTKSGKRIITVGKYTYQVKKSGKAAAGWSSNKKKRFDKTGLLMKGICIEKGKFYAASKKGVYNAKLTTSLNAAGKKGLPAIALRKLLGTPKSEVYAASCNFAGDDGLWEYDNFIVTTARLKDVAPLTESAISQYKSGQKLEEPYETIASIQAR